MGKGSGACDRPGITLAVTDSIKTESTLNGGIASVHKINTTLELQRPGQCWFTKDDQATFLKKKEGWIVDSTSDPIRKAFKEYGITSTIYYKPTYFPSLKTARQAVSDVSLETGLNIDSRLTRQKYAAYKIGDLPLRIRKNQGYWRIITGTLLVMPASLKKDFHTVEEFYDAWSATGSGMSHYPTRSSAHQAVTNWLAQTIAVGK
jgi:hypothetical protein